MSDVDHPEHYTRIPGVECIDVAERFNFNLGNAMKYLWRAGFKPGSDAVTDLDKARWYLSREIDRLQRDGVSCWPMDKTMPEIDDIPPMPPLASHDMVLVHRADDERVGAETVRLHSVLQAVRALLDCQAGDDTVETVRWLVEEEQHHTTELTRCAAEIDRLTALLAESERQREEMRAGLEAAERLVSDYGYPSQDTACLYVERRPSGGLPVPGAHGRA